MDGETSTRNDVDLLESVLLDEKAEPTYVSLSLLEDITDCFSSEHEIGKGGFAVVYKGIVGKGKVAVKKLSTFNLHEDKFHKEVECLIKARHKNIVRFLGYCSDTQGRIADAEGKFVMADIRNWLLCFEYIPNGSLKKYITDASSGLEWRERYMIIKGICEGLLHLHERRILHLDLKPGNILVDDDMIPKITDFGLSRCLDKEQTGAITSNMFGSLGYFAPELFRGQVAFASDIYSLGVIILEILTGEKGCPEDDNVVENWMTRLEGSDQRDTQLEQIRICTKIGIECMDFDPKKRPVVRHIYDMLDKTASTVETVISSSSVELEQQDIEEQAEMEGIAEYDGDGHWQQGQEEGPGDQWGEGPGIPSSSSSVFFKNIFTTKSHRNYMRNGGPTLKEANVKLYKKRELQKMLKDSNVTGNSTSGEEYKGVVDNEPVKLKKLLTSGPVLQNVQFASEVIIQYQIIHKSIVRLIGICVELDNPILVYEVPSKGSLHDILHGNNKLPLNLDLRVNIAAELAGALAYFHSACHIRFLHGDLKPATIFFDDNFVPKISNFGMSRFNVRDYEHTGIVLGEISYTDPEYLRTGVLTEGSDVYSFGVVMLELLTRKKTKFFDNSLVTVFLQNHKKGRKSTELFDKEIALNGDLELLESLAEIAVECINHDVARRPRMMDVSIRISTLHRSHKLTTSKDDFE